MHSKKFKKISLTVLLFITVITLSVTAFANANGKDVLDNSSIKIVKGDILFSEDKDTLKTIDNGFVIIENGYVKEVTDTLPEEMKNNKVIDYGDKLVIPGFVDLHLHAPQFTQCGLGMDMQLIDWLNTYTFPNEKKFSDVTYAKKIYSKFTDELVKQGTLNSVVFATIHKQSTEALFDLFIEKNIGGYIGKVNMDRNSPEFLTENTDTSISETEEIIKKYKDNKRVKPIVTPRFAPTSTEKLLEGLGELAKKYNIPVQSHLDENRNEIEWVKSLYPEIKSYSEVYNKFGLFGQTPTLMAHCIHNDDSEIELMKKNNVVAVHCPDSNMNLSSGIMPIRKYLEAGVEVGLGSDIGAGQSVSMPNTIVRAIQLSKIESVNNPQHKALSLEEAFYLGTKGGGKFFGNVGSFDQSYSFDALVIDDNSLGETNIPLKDRLQRFLYCGDDRNIIAKYFEGKEIK